MSRKQLLGMAIGLAFLAVPGVALAGPLTFTAISTPFNSPIGIDYHEPTNSVVMSVNYPGGNPNALERVNQDGTHSAFSTLSGIGDEVKIATVRSGNLGGFVTGTLFVGNGDDGEIVKVNADGSGFVNPWVDLGSGVGLMRGSLYVDRTGVWGYDLIACTTTGEVWRVNSAGVGTKIADVGVHLEGLLVVPNDVSTWGPLAGKIIAGAEGQGRMYIFGTDGTNTFITPGVAIEDIDLIEANSNFFGVNFGTGRLLGVAASQWTTDVGAILLTQESHSSSGLYKMTWSGSGFGVNVAQYTIGAGSAGVGQWEHVTFAPAGIVEIPPTTVPTPSAFLGGLGLLGGLTFLHRRRRAQQLS